ncbi:Hint domain-containing protein [Aliiroseovarius sp. F20344]|nr:Hint domain-containing protein [Aliiroseovarius sp. F20344]
MNEVLVDPNGATNYDTDGNGNARGGDEFLEIANTSNTAIDISGLELWDQGRGNWFTFPPCTVLEPVAVVVRNVQNGDSLPAVTGDNLAFDADFGSNVFNNSQDNIVIYDPTADEFIQSYYNGDNLDDPVNGNGYNGFSSTATRVGSGEDMGNDTDGLSIQRTASGFTGSETPTPGTANVCFTNGTRILTERGFVPVERLRAGDLVQTLDAGPQPLRWIFARRVNSAQMMQDAKLRPIKVELQRTDLGGSEAPLTVSRQHRILVEGKIAQRMFGTDQVLLPAKDLLESDVATLCSAHQSVIYFHLLFDAHHILNANGIAVESLFIGAQSTAVLSDAAREELEILFPTDEPGFALPQMRPARAFVSGRKARKLVERHQKNARALTVPFF